EGEPVGTVTINGDNTITYVPRPGWVGLDTFSYVVVDSSGAASSATVTISIPAALLAAANELTERLGTAVLPFEAPKPDLIETPELVGFTSGITLISKAFFQSLGALGLPLAFLGFGVGVVVVLGAFTEVPLLLIRRNRRFYSVVRLDRGRRLSVVADPEQPGLPIYLYEATAAGVRSLDRPKMFGDLSWTPVESPAGDGWVESRYLTETVDLEFFLEDSQAVSIASSFVEALRTGGDIERYVTDSGLSIALTNHPVFVPAEEVSEAMEHMSRSDGHQGTASPGQVAFIDALAHLREAVAATPNVDARISHSKRSLIPVEVLNYQYLVLDSQGENSWLLYLEYRRGKPFIAGFGLDV
ncbi:MAG: cadherin-like domain-containing protein, partial [Acidimicrobiia bacterium]|nr:cadherin-like domain-containing protein [Acidimicrobiia bacterium]